MRSDEADRQRVGRPPRGGSDAALCGFRRPSSRIDLCRDTVEFFICRLLFFERLFEETCDITVAQQFGILSHRPVPGHLSVPPVGPQK